jgi:hypothetical protein
MCRPAGTPSPPFHQRGRCSMSTSSNMGSSSASATRSAQVGANARHLAPYPAEHAGARARSVLRPLQRPV